MDHTLDAMEGQRLALQTRLDAQKMQADRNRLGQFATPMPLARDILSYARTLLPPRGGVRFLDPAFGTGAFYSAARKVFQKNRLQEAVGFEIDPHYGAPAASLWEGLVCLVMSRALSPANKTMWLRVYYYVAALKTLNSRRLTASGIPHRTSWLSAAIDGTSLAVAMYYAPRSRFGLRLVGKAIRMRCYDGLGGPGHGFSDKV